MRSFTVDSEFLEEGDDINNDFDRTESCQEVDLSTFNEDVNFRLGTRIEALYCGKARFSPSVTFSNGTFGFDHENGERKLVPLLMCNMYLISFKLIIHRKQDSDRNSRLSKMNGIHQEMATPDNDIDWETTRQEKQQISKMMLLFFKKTANLAKK
mmetsp:Transcript_1466/g.1740  ORF Transcript_1466/g.1740 Transcript_1466/m.1740 type:complete len:155 (-) Transcript_1466:612-1076(-)